LPRAVDRRRFEPARRDPAFWRARGIAAGCKLLRVVPVVADAASERLLVAVAALVGAGHPVQLVVVGDGPGREELSRRFHHPAIHFTGRLDEVELATAHASADLYVDLDVADLRSHRLTEALASGTPALTAASGPAAALISESGAGVVVDVGDPGTLLDGLRLLVVDAPRRAAAARAARQLAARLPSWADAFGALGAGSPPAEAAAPALALG
jgi:glycosyltransferase involved in cell wall biosynthesis